MIAPCFQRYSHIFPAQKQLFQTEVAFGRVHLDWWQLLKLRLEISQGYFHFTEEMDFRYKLKAKSDHSLLAGTRSSPESINKQSDNSSHIKSQDTKTGIQHLLRSPAFSQSRKDQNIWSPIFFLSFLVISNWK